MPAYKPGKLNFKPSFTRLPRALRRRKLIGHINSCRQAEAANQKLIASIFEMVGAKAKPKQGDIDRIVIYLNFSLLLPNFPFPSQEAGERKQNKSRIVIFLDLLSHDR